MTSGRFTPTPGTIADQLRRRLLALEYPAFARCVCSLLEGLGYEDARPAGRREWKGYNRPGGGGYDLEAALPGGVASRRVVAQIKQFDALAVHQRSVDELRGACLRAQAAEGLLVTTSAFSAVVRKQAAAPDHSRALVAPVRLIDGQELLGLLIRHRLGVRESVDVRERGRGGARRLDIDEAFFGNLAAPGTPADTVNRIVPGATPPRPPYGSAPLTWSVTVLISGSRKETRSSKGRKRNAGREGTDRGDGEGGS
jgi:hypothetical protein